MARLGQRRGRGACEDILEALQGINAELGKLALSLGEAATAHLYEAAEASKAVTRLPKASCFGCLRHIKNKPALVTADVHRVRSRRR